MFFIGVFGVNHKSELLKTKQNIVCPVCGAYGRYDVIKLYKYFHIFFIPTIKWDNRYFIKTYCCDKYLEIKKEKIEKLWDNDFNVNYYDINFD